MADGDELLASGFKAIPPPVEDDPAFVRYVLGLGSWPPRRPLNALQRARIARGITQQELAAELGVSRHTASSLENRRHVPSVRLALAVASALRGTVEELFASDEGR
jgi:putative transcriptional regulator